MQCPFCLQDVSPYARSLNVFGRTPHCPNCDREVRLTFSVLRLAVLLPLATLLAIGFKARLISFPLAGSVVFAMAIVSAVIGSLEMRSK